MARTKVDNKLNVIIGTKAQIEGDTSIPKNSIIVVTDEELKAEEITYSDEKNVKEAIEDLEVDLGNIDDILDSILGPVVVELTQAQYDALSVYDNNTYYLIVDEGSPGGYNVTITVPSNSYNAITFYDSADFENQGSWNLLGTIQPGQSDTYFVESGYICIGGGYPTLSNFVNCEEEVGYYSRFVKILGDNASFSLYVD